MEEERRRRERTLRFDREFVRDLMRPLNYTRERNSFLSDALLTLNHRELYGLIIIDDIRPAMVCVAR